MNITITKAQIAPCCANCQLNEWTEFGPHCLHPAHWNILFAEVIDGVAVYSGDTETEDGEIEWNNVCEHHRPGKRHELPYKEFKELVIERLAEFKTTLEAQAAANDAKRDDNIPF